MQETNNIGIDIRNRYNGEIIFKSNKHTHKGAIEDAIKNKINLRDSHLSGFDLSGLDLSGLDFSNADLSDTNINNTKLHNTEFSNVKLYGRTDKPIILETDQVDDFLAALGFKINK